MWNQFLSARPRGTRRGSASSRTIAKRFYPRVRVGRDRRSPLRLPRRSGFYPRVRVGRDMSCRHTRTSPDWFLSARPRGTRRRSAPNWNSLLVFLSARPRGTRHKNGVECIYMSYVSIRASAWDATHLFAYQQKDSTVSIRASAWDATWQLPVRCFR